MNRFLRLAALAALGGLLLSACSDAEPAKQAERPAEPQHATAEKAAPNAQAKGSDRRRGWWKPIETGSDEADLTDEQRAEIAKLEKLGYAAGVDDVPDKIGVTRNVREKTAGGIHLFTSAHGAAAQLMNEQGEVLHEWSYPFRKVWPNYPEQDQLATFWRRNWLFPNGDLLAIYEGLGIIKVDKDSNLLWANGLRAHHDLQVLPDGTIWVLSRRAHMVRRINETKPVLEDFVTVLGPDGEERSSLSLLEALENSEFKDLWDKSLNWDGDLFHTNSLEVLDGRLADVNPAFRKGNLLVSLLLLDVVGVVDPEKKVFVWAKKGPYHVQHDAQVLDNGHILIFDNQGVGPRESRILEMDPTTWEPVWTYVGSERQPFFSETCGLAQRLPDGNTLITESDRGRAFEVTPEGGIVWEYYNTHRAGARNQFIAAVMEMTRLPADFPLDWLE